MLLSLVLFALNAYADPLVFTGKTATGAACTLTFTGVNIADPSAFPILLTREPEFDENGKPTQYANFHLETQLNVNFGASSPLLLPETIFHADSHTVDLRGTKGPEFSFGKTLDTPNGAAVTERNHQIRLSFSLAGKPVSYAETIYRFEKTQHSCERCDPLDNNCDCPGGEYWTTTPTVVEASESCAL